MHQFSPYLFFPGTCAEALNFYASTLGAKIEMMMKNSEAPGGDGMPGAGPDAILHATISLGSQILMASDDPDSKGMKGFSVSLSYPTFEEAERIFNALADGGTVNLPFGKTFWAEGFGMLVDRFGTPWMVNVEH